MDALGTVLEHFSRDPVFAYSLLAAVFLGVVSLGAGWARRDYRPLLRAPGVQQLVIAVCAAVVLAFLARTLGAPLLASGPPWLGAWLGGLERLPLYLLALGYGPSAGLLAGGLFLAVGALSMPLHWAAGVLLLELVVLGWLAVYPSPRLSRWAGPLNAGLAFLLAWLSAGLALVQGLFGASGAAAFTAQPVGLGGFLLTLLVLFLLSPYRYRLLFPDSALKQEVEGRLYPWPPLRRTDTSDAAGSS